LTQKNLKENQENKREEDATIVEKKAILQRIVQRKEKEKKVIKISLALIVEKQATSQDIVKLVITILNVITVERKVILPETARKIKDQRNATIAEKPDIWQEIVKKKKMRITEEIQEITEVTEIIEEVTEIIRKEMIHVTIVERLVILLETARLQENNKEDLVVENATIAEKMDILQEIAKHQRRRDQEAIAESESEGSFK